MPCIRRRRRIQAAATSPIHCYPHSRQTSLININFTPSDRVVSLTAELTTPVSASIYIRATTATEQATLVLQLAAVDPPPLAAAFDDSRPIVLTGYSGLVATVNSGGGRGNYRYGLIDGAGDNAGFTIGATDGRLSLTDAQDTPTILTAAATVNDEHPNTPALTLSLTLRVVDVLVFTPDRADIRITTYRSVPYALHTATVQNPSGGDVSYSLLSTFPANFTDNINFTPSDRVVSLTAELTTPVSASHLHSCDDGYGAGDPGVAIGGGGSAAAGGGLSQCIGLCIDRRDGRCRIAVGIRRRRRLYLCRRRRLYGERRRIAELGGGG